MNQITLTDQQIVDMIDRIAVESSRNEKERLLADLASTSQGRRLIHWCYSPFITFGITQKAMPNITPQSAAPSQFSNVEGLLTQLSERQLTGIAARTAVDAVFASVNPAAQRLLWLCLNKDLKAGVAAASIKAVDPSLVPIFAVMRAQTYEEKRIKSFPVAVEPKLDGHRVTFISKEGSGGFFTRTGKVIESLDHMVRPTLDALRHWANLDRLTNGVENPTNDFLCRVSYVRGCPQVALDGEMMSDKGFAETSGALRRQGENADVRFHVFDMLTWEDFDAMGAVEISYRQRRAVVENFAFHAEFVGIPITATEMTMAHSHDEIQEIYQRHRAAGQEGAMVKLLDSPYHKKKSADWLKLKGEEHEDLPVVGVFMGQNGTKNSGTIGGLIVKRGDVLVRVSGLTDAERDRLWDMWQRDAANVGVDPQVGYAGHAVEGAELFAPGTCEILGWLAEIEFHEETKDKSLRHPRFVCWRHDKTGEVEK